MKLLINEDELASNPMHDAKPSNRLADRYGVRNPYSDIVRAPRREVDEATIMQLVDLGFNRRRATDALNRNQGNVELSVEYLLSLPQDAFDAEDHKQPSQQNDANMQDDVPAQVEHHVADAAKQNIFV